MVSITFLLSPVLLSMGEGGDDDDNSKYIPSSTNINDPKPGDDDIGPDEVISPGDEPAGGLDAVDSHETLLTDFINKFKHHLDEPCTLSFYDFECDLCEIANHFCVDRIDVSQYMRFYDRTPAETGVSVRPFSQIEITTTLRAGESKSPGPDRITYSHWRNIDPELRVLVVILNVCKKFKTILIDWKRNKTILIHKKGNRNLPQNWHSISISNTIYKLYVGTFTKHLTNWITRNKVLSVNQIVFFCHRMACLKIITSWTLWFISA